MIAIQTVAAFASQVAGVPVTLSCEADASFPTSTGAGIAGASFPLDGFVLRGIDGNIVRVLHVRQSLCDAAIATTKPHAEISSDSGRALAVIDHEATHVRLNSLDEAAVECAASQNAWQLVRLFKYPARVAQLLLASMAAHHQKIVSLYPDYRSAAC